MHCRHLSGIIGIPGPKVTREISLKKVRRAVTVLVTHETKECASISVIPFAVSDDTFGRGEQMSK
jgi:hypothetical protein